MSSLSLSHRAFRLLLPAFGAAFALIFLADVARRPLALVPCGPPSVPCRLGDPAIATSVLGRAWSRFERGEPWNRDDRVFAPYPDTWALSEGYLVEAAVGYPWARLFRSPALGYDVPYALACLLAFCSAGALFLRLAGPGWPALVGALLFAWSPARQNGVGVLTVLWSGLVPLAIAFGLDVLRRGRYRDAGLFAATWLALGMGSLYGLFMGALTAGFVLLACGLFSRERRARLPLLAAGAVVAAVPLVFVHRPLFSVARDFDLHVSMRTFEGQSADLASLFHHAGFSVPLRAAFDRFLPGFPPGAPGFFPGLFTLALAGLWLARPREQKNRVGFDANRPETDVRFWAGVAAVAFLCALGPTVHLLGRSVFPGPWRLLTALPVFSSMRGLFRFDQWFFLALAACVTLALAELAPRPTGSGRGRALAGVLLVLLAVDVWPRPIAASALPEASPFQEALASLDRNSIVAVYPFERATSERAWVEQLFHGRRVLNGFQSFPTPVHLWLDGVSHTRPATETLAIYRQMGASAIECDLDAISRELQPAARDACEALATSGARRVGRGPRTLYLFPPLSPLLVDPRALTHLSFAGEVASLSGLPGRLSFRLGSGTLPVRIEEGASSRVSTVLRIPLVGAGGMMLRLDRPPAPGARIVDARRNVEIGVAKGSVPASTAVPLARTSTRSERSPTP